jgi:hypothetical protein
MTFLRWVAIGILLIAQPAIAADAADSRQPLAVTAAEKAYILGQMRLFLASIQMIVKAAAKGDTKAVADAAAARGRRQNAGDPHFPKSLGAKLPPLWKQMGSGVRGGFDSLADSARSGATREQGLTILSETMRNCVACHQTYRLVDIAP